MRAFTADDLKAQGFCISEMNTFRYSNAVVANNIYKARFVETFFDEANVLVPGEVPMTEYRLPDGRLHMAVHYDRPLMQK